MTQQSAYAAAGVDIEAGDRAVELMKEWVGQDPPPRGARRSRRLRRACSTPAPSPPCGHPVLATSTDGVGTKVAIAQAMDVHDTIGFDLVGMVVDDLVVCGAEPLFMTDYIACGKVVPERIAAIVRGIAEACVQAGCALLGGETAEHPGPAGARRVRRRRRRHRRRRAGPHPRRRPRPARRRGPGAWSPPGCTPTATRWSATSAGAGRLGSGPGRPRARPHAGRGAAGADPDLRPRLPGADRRRRGARDEPRHRRRPGQQPGPGGAGRRHGADRPRHLGPAAGLRAGAARSAACPAPDLEATLNLGVGMVAVLPEASVTSAVGCSPDVACGRGSAVAFACGSPTLPGAVEPGRGARGRLTGGRAAAGGPCFAPLRPLGSLWPTTSFNLSRG